MQSSQWDNRSSLPVVFLRKGVLKICSKFTGEHPCRSAISIKLQSNFIEITLQGGYSPVNLLHIFRILPRTVLDGCFWSSSTGVSISWSWRPTAFFFIEKDTPAQIFQKTYFIELLKVTASESESQRLCLDIIKTSKSIHWQLFCKVFWGVFLPENLIFSKQYNISWEKGLFCWIWRCTVKMRCSVKDISLCLRNWGVLDREEKLRRLLQNYVNIYLFSWDNKVFLFGICLPRGNKMAFFWPWTNQQAGVYSVLITRGVLVNLFPSPEHLNSRESKPVFISGKRNWWNNSLLWE